MTEAYKVS